MLNNKMIDNANETRAIISITYIHDCYKYVYIRFNICMLYGYIFNKNYKKIPRIYCLDGSE